ncbi:MULTISPECIES: TetR/AcrR family transcriptional regulator [unclassified Pseudodesulfovibrio]|uniref:TetR/AcrR family transcriptional regulator n=1 Tax=unclassified Pseudodesulfovibrio TaxID=2661612 RepID=UPI000FEBF5F2|nr:MULTISPECIES: TetR/AcrR family transcriptional regulator [unclassified Pseudodesulfovibrio]MCJ2163800.1 TetR/AcrR family transcriptional regulator [Pseudodesulfovibrio sp. S3-i]RWU05952.1 TetR/AcrR family transcriptional regulator [Pseudodesulfovibrio sp. S3]
MSKKERILLAAQEIFARCGYAGTTMKMVAEQAGVASGLVFHYYDSKENLFMVAGSELIDTMITVLRDKTMEARNGCEALSVFVKAYLDFTIENESTFPTIIRCSPFSDDNPDLDRNKIGAKFRELIDMIDEFIVRGMEDGSIVDLPATQTAFMVYANIVGAVRTRFLTPYDIPGLYEEARAFVVRSVCATS